MTKSEPLETKEQSYVGGEADSAFHNLTDLSRDADSTKDGCGNATARTCIQVNSISLRMYPPRVDSVRNGHHFSVIVPCKHSPLRRTLHNWIYVSVAKYAAWMVIMVHERRAPVLTSSSCPSSEADSLKSPMRERMLDIAKAWAPDITNAR